MKLTVNGESHEIDAPEDMPLLWALRDLVGLKGTKFGCGVQACGACSVMIDGELARSCGVAVADVEGAEVTTIEGLSEDGTHPLQLAWIAEQVPQCGYCQPGQIMRAAALLDRNPNPGRDEIVEEMSANLCRCGTYQRIFKAVERAAQEV